jgi:hypothetical protein
VYSYWTITWFFCFIVNRVMLHFFKFALDEDEFESVLSFLVDHHGHMAPELK